VLGWNGRVHLRKQTKLIAASSTSIGKSCAPLRVVEEKIGHLGMSTLHLRGQCPPNPQENIPALGENADHKKKIFSDLERLDL
jgi:hypothetical protein